MGLEFRSDKWTGRFSSKPVGLRMQTEQLDPNRARNKRVWVNGTDRFINKPVGLESWMFPCLRHRGKPGGLRNKLVGLRKWIRNEPDGLTANRSVWIWALDAGDLQGRFGSKPVSLVFVACKPVGLGVNRSVYLLVLFFFILLPCLQSWILGSGALALGIGLQVFQNAWICVQMLAICALRQKSARNHKCGEVHINMI
jgi:hypothetical protein